MFKNSSTMNDLFGFNGEQLQGPGSFIEVRKILPLLVQTSADGKFPSFHVVAFSLPGYGFSEAPKKPGFVAEHYAEVRMSI